MSKKILPKTAKKIIVKKIPKKRLPRPPLKIMVSSTVFGFETELEQIYAILRGWGYEVLMSHKGTLFIPPGVGNEQACIEAVGECDLFLGIITTRYGSGITHTEIKHAIEIDKPRWFVAHGYIPFARTILRQYMYQANGDIDKAFKFEKTDVMDNTGVIHMYNDAIESSIPRNQRKSHWAQPFFHFADLLLFLEYQFKDQEKLRKKLYELNNPV